MYRAPRYLIAFSMLSLTVFSTGCDDAKKRVGVLEQSNQRLASDLQAARDEAARLRQENEACQSELALARDNARQLSSQLAARATAKPEPQAPAGWTSVPGGAMIALEGSMLFDPGQVKLRPAARRTLEKLASELRNKYADKDILVYGHTDTNKPKKSGYVDNFQLSTERALAVVRWLADRGIDPKRLVACGCGEHRPRAANSSEKGKSRNRRVEIFALNAVTKTASR